jgi:hypothetical protein
MKAIYKKLRVRLTWMAAIGLLSGVVCWIVIESRNCSSLSALILGCPGQTQTFKISAPHNHPAPFGDTSLDTQQPLSAGTKDRNQNYKKMQQQDIYFLSKQDYDNFMLGLSFLFYRAYRENPSSETKPYEIIDLLRDECLLDYTLPEDLIEERFEIRHMYRKLQRQKKLWEQYQQEKYEGILETTLEPSVISSQKLNLENEDNRKYFLELESDFKLHRRLIRDVRMFHDEIQFQQKQFQARQQYELYDIKLKLSPFAKESGLVDALQQALSALSVGVYEREAVGVIDRLGEAYTKPIRQLHEKLQNSTEPSIASKYNYDIYIVHGKKLLEYTDTLAQQSLIALEPSTRGELDIFKRRLSQSFYDLYQIGLNETISSAHLDFEELEQDIRSMR